MFNRLLEKLGIYRFDHIKVAYLAGLSDGLKRAMEMMGAENHPMPPQDGKVINLAQYKLEKMK